MKVLLKSVKIIDKQSAYHEQVVDVLLREGKIEKIGKSIKETASKTIEAKGLCLTPGFVDLHANFGEPGYEHREDIQSGLNTAMKGGFTRVCVMPSTDPCIQDKQGVQFLKQKSSSHPVHLEVIGAMTIGREGKDLSEMYDMQQAGAIAFSDALNAVQDAGMLSRSLLYAKGINSYIISFPEDKSISNKGKMNEGEMSTMLGLKGNPSLAEEIMVARDLFLAEYQDARIHLTQISSAKSVDIIRAAKKRGVKVTADVSIHHLMYDDEVLEDFDSNFKLQPPLRRAEDIKALLQGLKDGTIDAISSAHTPLEVEHKNVEFEIAKQGMISLQTVFSQVLKLQNKQWSLAELLECISNRARNVLNIDTIKIKETGIAELVLFDQDEEWIYDTKSNASKSRNSNLFNTKIKGKIKGIYSKGQYQSL